MDLFATETLLHNFHFYRIGITLSPFHYVEVGGSGAFGASGVGGCIGVEAVVAALSAFNTTTSTTISTTITIAATTITVNMIHCHRVPLIMLCS